MAPLTVLISLLDNQWIFARVQPHREKFPTTTPASLCCCTSSTTLQGTLSNAVTHNRNTFSDCIHRGVVRTIMMFVIVLFVLVIMLPPPDKPDLCNADNAEAVPSLGHRHLVNTPRPRRVGQIMLPH